MNKRDLIAKRAMTLLRSGDVVNLGIGIPERCALFTPPGLDISYQCENGYVGVGTNPAEGMWDGYTVTAGGHPSAVEPYGAFFDSAVSLGLIRGGHITAAILGGIQVSENGDLANWNIPGQLMPGIGGSMDLAVGARKVIVAMEHCTKTGAPKIVRRCTYPLTAVGVVNYIVTEYCILHCTSHGLFVVEMAPGVSLEALRATTDAELHEDHILLH